MSHILGNRPPTVKIEKGPKMSKVDIMESVKKQLTEAQKPKQAHR